MLYQVILLYLMALCTSITVSVLPLAMNELPNHIKKVSVQLFLEKYKCTFSFAIDNYNNIFRTPYDYFYLTSTFYSTMFIKFPNYKW